ncbi:MAG: nodulation efficiency protein D [Sulfurimonas sp.]|nr:nodulation efficiency protein D [Sulfurimonas sp.]
MENQILSLISPTILVAIGIGLIALEMISFSFILFWFGLASIIVGGLSLFPIYSDGLWQLASIAIIAMGLLFVLRAKFTKIFLKSKDKEHNDNFLNEKGIGIIKNGKVYYKATYWDIDLENNEVFVDEEKVTVLGTGKGIAHIQKLISA